MRDSLILAWYLLAHGFRVVRFDNTRHEGTSEGDMIDFTIGSAIDDLGAVIEFAKRELGAETYGVVGVSLSFRAAVRALHARDDARLLFGIVGTPNVRHTIRMAVGIDLFAMADGGAAFAPSYSVDGHAVDGGQFARDGIARGLDLLAGTRAEVAACRFPVAVVAGEEDEWVLVDDVRAALDAPSSFARAALVLPGVSHRLGKNPIATALALREMVVWCARELEGRALAADDVVHPTVTELVRVRKLSPGAPAGTAPGEPRRDLPAQPQPDRR
jgi:pimeloyl-ACP methyl ester carboxylesterase